MKKLFLLLSLAFTHIIVGTHPDNPSIYYQEFKALKKEPFYSIIFDRQAKGSLRSIVSNVQTAAELNSLARLFRARLCFQNPIPISALMMPKLYAYVEKICKQQNMRMPTIYITQHKTTLFGSPTVYTDSTKILASSGAILIGQDLLLETSQKTLEAAIAYELAHIKFNHGNKYKLAYLITPPLALYIIIATRGKLISLASLLLLLPRFLIGKQFEKEADTFIYKTMNNGQGLIELCNYFQRKKQKMENDYADAYTFVQNAHIGSLDYIGALFTCYLNSLTHKCGNLFDWICYSTIISPYQSNEARIKTAQAYLDTQRT